MAFLVDILANGVVDAVGEPLANGVAYIYRAGTTNLANTYLEDDIAQPGTNPITLNSAGKAEIYVNEAIRLVIEDANGNTIDDIANIGGQFSSNLVSTNDVTATAGTIPVQDGVTGRKIKKTNVTIDDSDNVAGINDLEVNSDTTLNNLTATTVPYLDGEKKLKSSSVTPTELGYLAGIFSQPVARGYLDVYTTSGTWTKADRNPKWIEVTVVGGGGGGGATDPTGSSEAAMAGCGGGGGAAIKTILAADLGATETVTVGAGGAGGATGNPSDDGADGGTSSFGSHCSATGGVGGSRGPDSSGNTTGHGGIGGVGSDGDVNFNGTDGSSGRVISGSLVGTGVSGSSIFGGGRRYTVTGAGKDATTPGAGGSGAVEGASEPSAEGGDGADGIVIVKEYY